MSMFLRAAVAFTAVVLSASVGQAQTVAMAGQYHEANGIIINIPQNPPVVACDNLVNDARCMKREQFFFGFPFDVATDKPSVGVRAARNIPTVGGAANGLAVGDPFVIPPLAFTQRLGQQVNIVQENVVRQLDTTFTAAAPLTARTKGNTTLTRRFSANNWQNAGNGQNNGLTGTAFAARLAATSVISATVPNETMTMTYTPGPNQFGGTATILLDGVGRLYLAGPQIDGIFSANFPSLLPVVGTNPVGDTTPGFRIRNAAGWDWTAMGTQMAGQFKGFPSMPSVVAPACTDPNPGGEPLPLGCNEINGFDTFGIPIGPLPGANSVKHMYAWTTGTVSAVINAVRNGNTQTDTVTGMGYDTTQTSMGVITQRNVGMVAGSWVARTDGVPTTQLTNQMVGMNLKFTPEPGATMALLSGLGLLGAFAARRRS